MSDEREGDDAELVAFWRAVSPRLVGTLALHCGNRWVAEEIAQEALAQLWERWRSVRLMASPQGWLFRVAFNLAASRFRRAAAERRARQRLEARVVPDGRAPADAAVDAAVAAEVREAVTGLPERQRAAIVLRYFADLSVHDTAAALGCRPGTVKSLTSRGVNGLRERLGVESVEEDAGRV